MSYVENCDKHGQYHADYICGDCFEENKIRVETLQSALSGLLEAHRVVFQNSIFAAFRSGKSNFIEAWKKAEAALDRG